MAYAYQGPQPMQAATNGSAASNTTDLATAYAANVTAGSLLLAHLSCSSATPANVTVTDSQGNTWTQITTATTAGSYQAVYWCLAGSSGANTVTFHSTTNMYKRISVLEWPGQATTTTDTSATGTASSSSATCPSITPSAAGNLVLVFFNSSNTMTLLITALPKFPWTLEVNNSGVNDMPSLIFSRVAPDTSAIADVFTLSASMPWSGISVSLKNMVPVAATPYVIGA